MDPSLTPPADRLDLADWRRRVADLYAEVRRASRADPVAAHALWREERERLYREHPQSPVPSGSRRAFRALHFAYDPAVRFEVRIVLPAESADGGVAEVEGGARAPGAGVRGSLALPNSGSAELSFRRLGTVSLPFAVGARTLAVFWMDGYAGGIFLPFRDLTNGHETYGAGRYVLDGAKSADLGGDPEAGTIVIDFNFAYQPSCAYDPRWACPLAPPENRLDVAIRAGERVA